MSPSNNILGVIPARLESTRLPRKVLRQIAGKPLLAWVVEAARRCPHLENVLVATDSAEVAALCREIFNIGGDGPVVGQARPVWNTPRNLGVALIGMRDQSVRLAASLHRDLMIRKDHQQGTEYRQMLDKRA